MLLSRALVMSAAMSPRYLTRPLLAQRAAALSMASPDIAAFTKEMWSEVTAAGQTKDADKIDAAFDKYYKADANLIRPSGNPLDMAGFKAMMASPDIIVESDVVASVDDVKEIAGGQAAVVVFTTLSKFSYKGTPNDDVAKFSVTYEKVDDTWKIVHLHRGTGQKPE